MCTEKVMRTVRIGVRESILKFLMGHRIPNSSASYQFNVLYLDQLSGYTSHPQGIEVNVLIPSQLPSAFSVCKTLKYSMGGADPCPVDVTLLVTNVVSFFTSCSPAR